MTPAIAPSLSLPAEATSGGRHSSRGVIGRSPDSFSSSVTRDSLIDPANLSHGG